jgi:hypothetical protein
LIKLINTDGKPRDKETEIKVNDVLKLLDQQPEDYIIGIDYAGLISKDYTVIAKLKLNKDGTIIYAGKELIET